MMTYEKRTILNAIPVGKANSITRNELKAVTGFTDRAIRRYIAEMVTDREADIISTSNNSGYYRANNVWDYTDAITNLRKKNFAIQQRLMALEAMQANFARGASSNAV